MKMPAPSNHVQEEKVAVKAYESAGCSISSICMQVAREYIFMYKYAAMADQLFVACQRAADLHRSGCRACCVGLWVERVPERGGRRCRRRRRTYVSSEAAANQDSFVP